VIDAQTWIQSLNWNPACEKDVEIIQNDARKDLLSKITHLESREKEAMWLVENACENRSVVDRWIERRDAWLKGK